MILLFVEERQNAPSDLDSLTAQQLDEKFKEIMMKKRGTYVNIYIDNYSFYHSVCSHLLVHRGVSPNHLYMNCHVTLIKLREISSSLSKKKGSWLNLHCTYSKIQYRGSIFIMNTCTLTLKLISPPSPNCIVTLLVIIKILHLLLIKTVQLLTFAMRLLYWKMYWE